MEDLLLGIDVGTTAVKAALFSLDGQLVGVGNVAYPIHYVRPGWVEQQPQDWWNATCQAVQGALEGIPQGARRVAGLAVSSQAPALIALDEDGQPLRPALIWMDRRAEAEVQQLVDRFGADEIFRITGNRPDAYYVAAKLLWFKTHEPTLFARTHQFVQINGYINYRLTDVYTLDSAHAALLQLREYGTDRWSLDLCEACGVDLAQLPPVYPGHHVQGEVTEAAAAATGLRAGTPVMVGTVDSGAAALEAGVSEVGIAAEVTGTSTVVIMPNAGGATSPALISMPHALPGMDLIQGAMVATGASLSWYRDQFGLVEQQAAPLLDADVFDLLTSQAQRIGPGSNGVLFLPYMMGERSPLWHTHARGVLFGLSLATTRGAVIRAILEGAAFALLHNIDVARSVGVGVDEVRSVGGGARSPLWCQIKADVLGMPVLLPQVSVGAPFGDAMLAGMGVGLFPDISQTLREIVQVRTIYEPNPTHRALYDDLYGVFRELYNHVRADFDRLAAVMATHTYPGKNCENPQINR